MVLKTLLPMACYCLHSSKIIGMKLPGENAMVVSQKIIPVYEQSY